MFQSFLAYPDPPSKAGPVEKSIEWYGANSSKLDELIQNATLANPKEKADALSTIGDLIGETDRISNISNLSNQRAMAFKNLFFERIKAANPENFYEVINYLVDKGYHQEALRYLRMDNNLTPEKNSKLQINALAKIQEGEDVTALNEFIKRKLKKPTTPDEIILADKILDKVVELKNPSLLDQYLTIRKSTDPALAHKEDDIYSTLKEMERPKGDPEDVAKAQARRRSAIKWDTLKDEIKAIDDMRGVPDGVSNIDKVIEHHSDWSEVLENPEKGISELLAKGDKETLMKIIDVIEDDKFFTVLTTKLGESNTPLRDDLISHVFHVRAQPDYIIKNTFSQTPSAITPQRRRYYQEYADNYLRSGDPQRIRNYIEYVLAQPYTSDMTQIDRLLISGWCHLTGPFKFNLT